MEEIFEDEEKARVFRQVMRRSGGAKENEQLLAFVEAVRRFRSRLGLTGDIDSDASAMEQAVVRARELYRTHLVDGQREAYKLPLDETEVIAVGRTLGCLTWETGGHPSSEPSVDYVDVDVFDVLEEAAFRLLRERLESDYQQALRQPFSDESSSEDEAPPPPPTVVSMLDLSSEQPAVDGGGSLLSTREVRIRDFSLSDVTSPVLPLRSMMASPASGGATVRVFVEELRGLSTLQALEPVRSLKIVISPVDADGKADAKASRPLEIRRIGSAISVVPVRQSVELALRDKHVGLLVRVRWPGSGGLRAKIQRARLRESSGVDEILRLKPYSDREKPLAAAEVILVARVFFRSHVQASLSLDDAAQFRARFVEGLRPDERPDHHWSVMFGARGESSRSVDLYLTLYALYVYRPGNAAGRPPWTLRMAYADMAEVRKGSTQTLHLPGAVKIRLLDGAKYRVSSLNHRDEILDALRHAIARDRTRLELSQLSPLAHSNVEDEGERLLGEEDKEKEKEEDLEVEDEEEEEEEEDLDVDVEEKKNKNQKKKTWTSTSLRNSGIPESIGGSGKDPRIRKMEESEPSIPKPAISTTPLVEELSGDGSRSIVEPPPSFPSLAQAAAEAASVAAARRDDGSAPKSPRTRRIEAIRGISGSQITKFRTELRSEPLGLVPDEPLESPTTTPMRQVRHRRPRQLPSSNESSSRISSSDLDVPEAEAEQPSSRFTRLQDEVLRETPAELDVVVREEAEKPVAGTGKLAPILPAVVAPFAPRGVALAAVHVFFSILFAASGSPLSLVGLFKSTVLVALSSAWLHEHTVADLSTLCLAVVGEWTRAPGLSPHVHYAASQLAPLVLTSLQWMLLSKIAVAPFVDASPSLFLFLLEGLCLSFANLFPSFLEIV